MATSGTYTFSPEIAEICEEAFERVDVDPVSLTARHARSARKSMNLLFSSWANRNIKLWTVEEASFTLTQSDGDYSVSAGTVAILEAYILRDGERYELTPMAREEYGFFASDDAEGMPSSFYFERTVTPTLYLWQLPENSTDELHYYRMRRIQDVSAAAETLDVPYRWYEAVVSGLAAKLALKYAPDRLSVLEQLAEREFMLASQEDRERTATRFRLNYRRR